MSSSDKLEGFSSSLFGGFSRRDVIKYVERLSNEHEEENSARIKEIDSLKARLAECEEDLKKTSEKLEETERLHSEGLASIMMLNDEVQRQKSCLEAALDECKELKEKNDKQQTEVKNLEGWKNKITKYKHAVQDLKEAKLKIANIELEAYQRADQIEREAKINAERIIKEFCASVVDLKLKFEDCSKNIEGVLDDVVTRTDKIQDIVSGFHADFSSDSEKMLEKLTDPAFTYTSAIETQLDLTDIELDDDLDFLDLDSEETEPEVPEEEVLDVPETEKTDIKIDAPYTFVEEESAPRVIPDETDSDCSDNPLPEKLGDIFSEPSDATKYDKYME